MMTFFKKLSTLSATVLMASTLTACVGNGQFIKAQEQTMQTQNNVVLINTFEVPKGKEAETLASWQKSADFLKTQDGYISTRLHQNLDPNGKFHLVNVAVWRSADDFQRATAKMRETMPDNPVEGVKFTPSLFRVIKSD